ERVTQLSFAPAPARLDTDSANFVLDLGPSKWSRLALRVRCDPADGETWNVGQAYRSLRNARHALRASSGRAARVEGSNAAFDELARRSVADLYMLLTET